MDPTHRRVPAKAEPLLTERGAEKRRFPLSRATEGGSKAKPLELAFEEASTYAASSSPSSFIASSSSSWLMKRMILGLSSVSCTR